MADSKVLAQTLRLQNVNHLFEEPDVSPFSDYYAEYSAKTGLDYLVSELYANPQAEQIKLNVLLPPEQIQVDLRQRTLKAIKRYSAAWARNAKQDIAESRYKGRSTLIIGFIVFFVFNGIGLWLNQSGNIWIENVGDAFIVIAWIIIWFALDILTVGVWQSRVEKRAYKALQSIDLSIEPDPNAGVNSEK